MPKPKPVENIFQATGLDKLLFFSDHPDLAAHVTCVQLGAFALAVPPYTMSMPQLLATGSLALTCPAGTELLQNNAC